VRGLLFTLTLTNRSDFASAKRMTRKSARLAARFAFSYLSNGGTAPPRPSREEARRFVAVQNAQIQGTLRTLERSGISGIQQFEESGGRGPLGARVSKGQPTAAFQPPGRYSHSAPEASFSQPSSPPALDGVSGTACLPPCRTIAPDREQDDPASRPTGHRRPVSPLLLQYVHLKSLRSDLGYGLALVLTAVIRSRG
jgi:hypothetical protein